MKIILSLAILFIGTHAIAELPQKFACSGSLVGSPQKIPFEIDIAGNKFVMDGKTYPVILAKESQLTKVEQTVACIEAEDADACYNERVGHLEEPDQYLHVINAILEDIHREYQDEGGLNLKTKINYAKIASGRVIAMEQSEDLGLVGMYEYYDKKGKLLGRLFFGGIMMLDCY